MRSHLGLGLLGLLLALTAVGCKRARPQAGPARVVATSEDVVVDGPDGHRRALSVEGEPLRIGDTIRVGERGHVTLRFDDGRVARLSPRARVRLLPAGADGVLAVEVSLGEAELEGGAGVLDVMTPRGLARLGPQAKMRIAPGNGSARFEVLLGRAVLQDGGKSIELGRGQGIEILLDGASFELYKVDVGMAVIETSPAAAPVSSGPVDTGEPRAGAAAPPGAQARSPGAEGAGPIELRIAAGESAVLHDSRGGTRVGFVAPASCAGALRVEVRRTAPRPGKVSPFVGPGGEGHLLKPGAYRYKARCLGANGRPEGPALQGRLELRRDGGTAPLPRYAPTNTLEADGRRYTVLYQSRLPTFRLLWPDAPARGPFILHLASGKGVRTETLPVAEAKLRSGELGEGPHRFWFTTETGAKAPPTVVDVRFDNAATTAQILSPRAESVVEPHTVVSGVALEGSEVSIDGKALEVDRQGRFRGEVAGDGAAARGGRSFAIRIAHRRLGVHYYLRRHTPQSTFHAGHGRVEAH